MDVLMAFNNKTEVKTEVEKNDTDICLRYLEFLFYYFNYSLHYSLLVSLLKSEHILAGNKKFKHLSFPFSPYIILCLIYA